MRLFVSYKRFLIDYIKDFCYFGVLGRSMILVVSKSGVIYWIVNGICFCVLEVLIK